MEFGLEREFMFQLRTEKADPFVGIVGALSKLAKDEVAVFQVLFEPVRENWSESIDRSVCHADGKPFFVNAPELAAAGKWKTLPGMYSTYTQGQTLFGWLITEGEVDHVAAMSIPEANSQTLDLNGLVPGSIRQTVGTIPGSIYRLTWSFKGNPISDGMDGSYRAAVLWNDVQLASWQRPGPDPMYPFETMSVNIVGTGTIMALK